MDFCLANEEKILKFVFRLIDEDNNEVITRKDIYKLLTKRFNKKLIFPVNAIKIGIGVYFFVKGGGVVGTWVIGS